MMIFPLNITSFFGALDITGLSNPEPESDCEAWEDMAFSAWPMPKIQGISWGFHGDLPNKNGDLIGFHGDLMGFQGDLIGFHGV